MEQGQACMLCRQAEADPGTCGRKLENKGICAHEFCLFFANKLIQKGSRDGVCLRYIRRAIKRAGKKECFVCGQRGAAITCREMGCDRSFHLPCAARGQCVTQYFGQYRSFCWEHSPEQVVDVAPEEGTNCLICMDRVEGQRSYSTMVCPACQHAWFHRACIQYQAIHTGIHCFCCPHCKNEYKFHMEMLNMGIRIPRRPPAWENTGAFAALNGRHGRCDASECLCPGGREQAEEEGPWELLLCCSCAAEGTHRQCSSLRPSMASWECGGCSGPSTASSARQELNSSGSARQSGLRSSHGSLALDNSSWVASGTSGDPPGLKGSCCSSHPGPDRRQNRLRLQHRAQNPYSRPRRHESSCVTAHGAETTTHGQLALEPSSYGSLAPDITRPSTSSQLPVGFSCGSPGLEGSHCSSHLGPVRVRGHSSLRHRDQNPSSRPSRCCDRSQSPRARAESSTHSQAGLGPSHTPLEPQSTSPRTNNSRRSRRPEPMWVRDCSRLRRRE